MGNNSAPGILVAGMEDKQTHEALNTVARILGSGWKSSRADEQKVKVSTRIFQVIHTKRKKSHLQLQNRFIIYEHLCVTLTPKIQRHVCFPTNTELWYESVYSGSSNSAAITMSFHDVGIPYKFPISYASE